jgi:hypothetical protein
MKRILLALTVVIAFFGACTDQYGNIKELVEGESIYPGKYDTIFATVGIERVEIDLLKAGRIPASQIKLGKASKTVVKWDDQTMIIDSVCSWVNIKGLTRSKMYRFKVSTSDEYGNMSIPVEITATPYFMSDVEKLTMPEPRLVNTSAGLQVGWPRELLYVMMNHCGMDYSYTDQDGIVHQGSGGPNSSLLVENVAVGQELTIDLVHRVVPKIANSKAGVGDDPTVPILDTIELTQQVELIVPQLSVRVNVARDKATSVSDQRNSNEGGSNAVDGVGAGGGRWVSQDNSNDHWIEIDLGGAFAIDGFQMWTGSGSNLQDPIRNFEFQVWDENTSNVHGWITVDSQTANTSPTYFANFVYERSVSKVRLLTHGQAARLFELEVYVTVTKPEMRLNVARSRDVTWSDSRNDNTEGGNQAVDGRRDINLTRWIASGTSIQHWLEIPFGRKVAIDGIKMWTGADAPNYNQPLVNFTFKAWDDEKQEWVVVVQRSGNTDPQLGVDFAPVETTKARLEISGQEVRVFELEIYSTIMLFE